MYIKSEKNEFITKSSSANINIILIQNTLTIKTLVFAHDKIMINMIQICLEKHSHITKRMIIEIYTIRRRYNINLTNVTRILTILKKQIYRLI